LAVSKPLILADGATHVLAVFMRESGF